MKLRCHLLGLALAAAPLAAQAENYLGILKPPRASLERPDGLYSFSASPINSLATAPGMEHGHQMKLGYKYSRYFSVEGQLNDFTRPGDPVELVADATQLRALGFEPRISLADGVREYVDWYRSAAGR